MTALVDLRRTNPIARLGAALLIAVALVLSLDWASATTGLVLVAVLLAFTGIPLARVLRRSAAVLIAAALTAVTILLYGQTSGRVHWQFLFVTISDGSIELAIATLLRVLAIGIPSVLLFIDLDPTELADGLGQIVRLPSRFVIGALAGFRLVGLLRHDWTYLGYARRARGLADSGRVRRWFGQTFALLVFAIRRGSKLATAMEARAFGAFSTRTWARPSRFGIRDAVLLAIGALIAAAAITVSVVTGNWNFIGAR